MRSIIKKPGIYYTILLFFFTVTNAIPVFPQSELDINDAVRINEAREIASSVLKKAWGGITDVQFSVLLITNDKEYLTGHPAPSAEFTFLYYDTILNSDVYWRDKVFAVNLLATFPLIDAIPVIVIGQPHNTFKKNSSDWTITLLHEHFHQVQMSKPDYFEAVEALNLSGGDETGMWMLNYDFPYDDPLVSAKFSELSQTLAQAVTTNNETDLENLFSQYYELKFEFEKIVGENNYKYFQFQQWQEGIARYVEYAISREIEDKNVSDNFKSLTDYKSFSDVSQEIFKSILSDLKNPDLSNRKREAFYSIGAGEAILLDKMNIDWKENYLVKKFYLGKSNEN